MGNNSRLYFILAASGAAIGLGNMWLYSFFSFKFTGLFFIAYLIALCVLGVPLLMLEFSIGQYFNKNVVDAFASIRKWFSAIGWLMVFNAFIVMSIYAVILSWHIIYFFVPFGTQWKSDPRAYFFNNVLQSSSAMSNLAQFSLHVFVALLLAWAIIFFCTRKGFESIKKYFLIIFPIFISLMFLFMLYSLSLENALAGVHLFLKPSFKSLLNFDVWAASFSLAMQSLGLSFGIMHIVARKSGKGFIVGNSFIVIIFKLLASIAMGLIIFGILGFLSMKHSLISYDPSSFDYGSSFTILAQAVPFFKPAFLGILFFIFLSAVFMLGACSLAYSISAVLAQKFNTKQSNAAIILIGFGFLFSFLFIIKPGFYIMDIMGHFVYYNILIIALLETLAVGWFFDLQKISDYINFYSALKIGGIWKFIIRYVLPLILLWLFLVQAKSDFLLNYKSYSLWPIIIIGAATVIAPIIAAFLMPQKLLDRK